MSGGRDCNPKGKPTEFKVSDFFDVDLGKAVSYGDYDINNN